MFQVLKWLVCNGLKLLFSLIQVGGAESAGVWNGDEGVDVWTAAGAQRGEDSARRHHSGADTNLHTKYLFT